MGMTGMTDFDLFDVLMGFACGGVAGLLVADWLRWVGR